MDEETDIQVFSNGELVQLDSYFKGTNAETAYLIGRYCGLRINECYGLKWENVDLDEGVIIIDRQMQYQNGLIKLVPLKTRNAKRVVYMNERLKEHLLAIKEEQDAYRAQAQYWVKNVENVSDPEMDYVANLYKQSAKTLDDRVAEIYKLRDPNIAEISYNHPPQRTKSLFAFFDKKQTNTELKITPIKAYDIIV